MAREIVSFEVENSTLLEITPVNENGMYQAMTAQVARGELTELVTKDGEEPKTVVTKRFEVQVAGKTGYGTTVDKALSKIFSIDDFTYDVSSEFFTASFKTNKPESDEVEARDDWAELQAVRVEAEAAIVEAQTSTENAQAARIQLSDILTGIQAKLKSAKAMAAWARGGKAENVDLMAAAPLLTKLGNGKNALSEAMRWSQLTEDQKALVPASITSGKGLDKVLRDSLDKVMEAAGQNIFAEFGHNAMIDKDHNGSPTVTSDAFVVGVEAWLHFVGVADSDYGTLSEGVENAKLMVEPCVKAFETAGGKHDDSDEGREYALASLALVYGIDLVEGAIKAEATFTAMVEAGSDEGNLNAANKERNLSLFVKRLNAAVTAEANKAAAEKAEQAAVKATAEAGDFDDAVKAEELPEAIAARFWNTINGKKTSEAKRDKIMEVLNMLHREQKRHEAQAAKVAAE